MPPAPALDHLAAAVGRVRDRPGAPRWTPLASLHLTVAFFGEVASPDPLAAALASVPTPGPVDLRLTGAGTFPARGAPRVLWVGVDGSVDALAELSRSAAKAAGSVGVPVRNEGRAYRPHLTIGRWPAAAAADPAPALGSYTGPHFAVDSWHLVRSHPDSVYETLATWPL